MQASSGANRLHRIQWYVLRPRYIKIILDDMRKNSLLQKLFWNRSDDDSQSERRNGSFAVAGVSIRNAIYLPDMLRHKRIQVRLNSWGRATIIYDKFFFTRRKERSIRIIVAPRLCAQIYCAFATLAYRLCRQSYANAFMWQVSMRKKSNSCACQRLFWSRFELRLTTAACLRVYTWRNFKLTVWRKFLFF